jgi:CubicO group peptidase (beta-lactamase class C family)
MVVVHSASKGLAAMTLALAHSRGCLDYDERVCSYWPEFAQGGKEHITVRQLLAHQAGLFAFDEHVDREVIANPDRLAAILARQRPAWPPGERQAYHAISLGFYQSELLRRVDPARRSLGQFFADEIAAPLGIEFYLRLPASLPNERLAPLAPINRWRVIRAMPWRVVLDSFNPRSVLFRSLISNPGTGFYLDRERVYAREVEAPSGLGVGTAHAIAKAYGVFASGGRELALRAETLAALAAPAIPSRHGFYDECLRAPVRFSLGFMKPNETIDFAHGTAFGAPGAGGAMGYADPETGIGYGYVTNRMGTSLAGDPRDLALRAALERWR